MVDPSAAALEKTLPQSLFSIQILSASKAAAAVRHGENDPVDVRKPI